MKIVKWDGKSYWNDLEKLSKRIDSIEGINTNFIDKVAILYTKVKAIIYLVLSDNLEICYGFFTLKDSGKIDGNSSAYVTDIVFKPEYSSCVGRWSRKILQFIHSLGFTEVRGRVKNGNTKAFRLWNWLGFEVESFNVVARKKNNDNNTSDVRESKASTKSISTES